MKQLYSIEDLLTKQFDDEEIEIVSNNLIYSLITGMFHYMKIKDCNKEELCDNKIIEICKKQNDWFNNYSWTYNQKEKYKKILDKIFYNLYRFGPVKCSNTSEEFLMKYGFKIKPSYKKKK